jgi:hypothetical protein
MKRSRRLGPLLFFFLAGEACKPQPIDVTREAVALGTQWDNAWSMIEPKPTNNNTASSTNPVGTWFGSVATLNNKVYGFGGTYFGFLYYLSNAGWIANTDSSGESWTTDFDNPALDIGPYNGGRAGFGLVQLPSGSTTPTKLLAVGGIHTQGAPPIGDIGQANVFDTTSNRWLSGSNYNLTLPNPSKVASGRCCYGGGCDRTCTASSNCAVQSPCALVDPPQNDGAQTFLHGAAANDEYALFVGALLGNPAHPPNNPSQLGCGHGGANPNCSSSNKGNIFTNNAVFYNRRDNAVYSIPFAGITYRVPGNCTTDADCGNNQQTCDPLTHECSPSYSYQAGGVPNIVMLNNAQNQAVICGGRSVFLNEDAFPYANTCQIFTPDFGNPSNSTWQLCAAWSPIASSTEDGAPTADTLTAGRAEVPMAVTSDGKVLLFGGKIRDNSNKASPTTGFGASRRIRLFDPTLCGTGNEYSVLTTPMQYPRENEAVVAIRPDTFLVIGGSQGESLAFGGNQRDNYQTEVITYDPQTRQIQTRCDAPLPYQTINGVNVPLAGSFGSQALLLDNGKVAYMGGYDIATSNCFSPMFGCSFVGSAHAFTVWSPGSDSCVGTPSIVR